MVLGKKCGSISQPTPSYQTVFLYFIERTHSTASSFSRRKCRSGGHKFKIESIIVNVDELVCHEVK